MDRGLLLKALVVVLALLFLLEPFAMSVGNWGKGDEGGEIYEGTANVNITIYGYGAFLYVQAPTQFQKTQIEGHAEVLSLEDAQNGWLRITLRDSAKTREVYGEFKEMGISTMAMAQVGLPAKYVVFLSDGTSAEINGGYQQVPMAPAMEPGRTVSYLIAVATDGENTLGVLDAQSYSYFIEMEIEGQVESAGMGTYSFSVPWEGRGLELDSLQEEYGEENVAYSRNDYIVFEPALSQEETLFLKKGYMTYISTASASVPANFTDAETVYADFGERAALPDSILTVNAQEPPELEYNYSLVHRYGVLLPGEADGYSIELRLINVTSEEEFSEGDAMVLRVNASVTGDTILGLAKIEIGPA